MGENTVRVLVMLNTTALAGTEGFVAKLPKLPGFTRAAARASER
jgi:hypothetical protein